MDHKNDNIYATEGGDSSEILRGIDITFLGVDKSVLVARIPEYPDDFVVDRRDSAAGRPADK